MSGVRGGEGDRESASSVESESSDNSGSDILVGTGGKGVGTGTCTEVGITTGGMVCTLILDIILRCLKTFSGNVKDR